MNHQLDYQPDFADLLDDYIVRANLSVDRLSKRADVPKPTIMNWRKGIVQRPRDWRGVIRVASALQLSEADADALLKAAHHLPIQGLLASNLVEEDRRLLDYWITLRAKEQKRTEQASLVAEGHVVHENKLLQPKINELSVKGYGQSQQTSLAGASSRLARQPAQPLNRQHRHKRDMPDRVAISSVKEKMPAENHPVESHLVESRLATDDADGPKSPDVPQIRQMPSLPQFHVNRHTLEAEAMRQLRQSTTHTLVLWGSGGCGKTTFATWLAHDLAHLFPDGIIWWSREVQGTQVMTGDAHGRGVMAHDDPVSQIQQWIAYSLNLPLKDGPSAQRAAELRAWLRQKRCLLILDDLWTTADLQHLQVGSEQTWVVVTTRDDKVGYALEAPVLRVATMNEDESTHLLACWTGNTYSNTASNTANNTADYKDLARKVGGLPLALRLCGAQLSMGIPIDMLLEIFHESEQNPDIEALDLDDPQSTTESLVLSFNMSFTQLSEKAQVYFAWLGYFARKTYFADELTVIWGTSRLETHRLLNQFRRFALLEQDGEKYTLHALLHSYAHQKLIQLDLVGQSKEAFPLTKHVEYRHAVWHIYHILWHPELLEGAETPSNQQSTETNQTRLTFHQTWPDVLLAVQWAIQHDSQLATYALIVAYTERQALYYALGQPLAQVAEDYVTQSNNPFEQALIYDVLGDIYLLDRNLLNGYQESQKWTHSLACFTKMLNCVQSSTSDTNSAQFLAVYTQLRIAGIHLLRDEKGKAVETAMMAQTLIQTCLPIMESDMPQARRIFYWLDLVYRALIRWEGLREDDVSQLAELASGTEQPMLAARGLSLYRTWVVQQKNRQDSSEDADENTVEDADGQMALAARLSIEAYRLLRHSNRLDLADDEVSFTNYRLKNRYSRHAAIRFARRRSKTTPSPSVLQQQHSNTQHSNTQHSNTQHSQTQVAHAMHTSNAIRWWLGATEAQRVLWLSWMLPRYLGADNRPHHPRTKQKLSTLQPSSQAFQWVDAILTMGVQRRSARLIVFGPSRPADHFLTGPEWQAMGGQRVFSVISSDAQAVIQAYMAELKAMLGV